MSVITISRGTFTGGKMLAECVAGKLGYQCIDRELIVGRAAQWGVSQDDLRTAIQKPPSILGQSRHTQYIYLALIQAALTQSIRSGNAIYHGLAAHLLLKRVPHILRVRIIAPLERRIRMVQERLKYGRAEAISYIEKMDRERRRWAHFLYGVDWADPSLYDLVLNLERVSIQEAGDIICAASQQPCFEFTPECERAMDDLALASRVRASLAIDRLTSDVEVDVTADAGSVSISGEARSANQRKEITRVVRAVPGVKSVQLDKVAVVAQF